MGQAFFLGSEAGDAILDSQERQQGHPCSGTDSPPPPHPLCLRQPPAHALSWHKSRLRARQEVPCTGRKEDQGTGGVFPARIIHTPPCLLCGRVALLPPLRDASSKGCWLGEVHSPPSPQYFLLPHSFQSQSTGSLCPSLLSQAAPLGPGASSLLAGLQVGAEGRD